MKVYKFGGASICDAEGVKNCADIIAHADDRLFVVVSAMGKITNALEGVLDHFTRDMTSEALQGWSRVEDFHFNIIKKLFTADQQAIVMCDIEPVCKNARAIISLKRQCDDYDMYYDQIVSLGEILSSKIVSNYLSISGIGTLWVDMRRVLITDNHFREANVLVDQTSDNLKTLLNSSTAQVFVGQGFIGANVHGLTTTLGREGSDYSGAIVASGINADSLTIWKDVPGIMNADPRYFKDTVHIAQMSYFDAVELAYNGAQIIHPKTIKPLKNNDIPLYVRPFYDYNGCGSVVCGDAKMTVDTPIYILKHNQVMITIAPHDFSFVLEDKFVEIFSLFERYRSKINLVQSSAVSLVLCVDASRSMAEIIEELSQQYDVKAEIDMELLTIRGYDRKSIESHSEDKNTMLLQRTETMLKIVRKKA